MKIYLDIDGVLVPANSWRRPEILEDGFPAFSTRATQALDKIISKSGATIALTTSHKSKYSVKEWIAIFKRRNLVFDNIMVLPENLEHLNRKNELLKWLGSNEKGNDFIIIDDDKSLNALPEVYKKRLIQTSASVGLTESLADEAILLIAKSKSELV